MVEWKKLGEICIPLKKAIIKQGDLSEKGNYPVINSGITLYGWYNSFNNEGNAFTLASRGEYAGYITYMERHFWAGGLCYPYRSRNEKSVITKYIYQYLKNKERVIMDTLVMRGGIPALNKVDVDKILIPIIPLSEQKRIVGILDTFTDSIENLKQQIDQRRKQYAYLIDNFFGGSLSEMKKKAENGTLHIEPLSAHGTFTRGRRFVRTDVVEEGQPCIHYGDMYTYYGLYADKANTHLPYDFPKKMRYAKKGDVVIVGAGENNEDIAVGLVWLGDEPAAVHDACYIYESDFEPMYLSYFLRSSIYHLQIKSHVVRGKICSISSDGIGKALIPIFPMEKQKEIVSKLLPFESLLKNLEAQLAQRQKQYEYYRNQLLTFE